MSDEAKVSANLRLLVRGAAQGKERGGDVNRRNDVFCMCIRNLV